MGERHAEWISVKQHVFLQYTYNGSFCKNYHSTIRGGKIYERNHRKTDGIDSGMTATSCQPAAAALFRRREPGADANFLVNNKLWIPPAQRQNFQRTTRKPWPRTAGAEAGTYPQKGDRARLWLPVIPMCPGNFTGGLGDAGAFGKT